MTAFTHLHVHTQYSLLDGAARIDDLLDRCAELGMDSLAITDHGVMYGVVDFYKAAKKRNIHPIIGCEVYVAPRTRFEMTAQDREAAHLILLCENEIGYRNLSKMVSKAFTEGYYYRPRVDHDLLREYHEGLIACSACLSGELPRLLMQNRYEDALELAKEMQEIFGRGNYFLEIQDHGIPEQRLVNPQILQIAKETGIGLVCTNDVHYVRQEDAQAQDILLCIQTGKTVEDKDRMSMSGDQFYLKSPQEMEQLFSWCPEALENTAEIAKRCKMDFTFGVYHLPDFPTPNNEDHEHYLRRLAQEGLEKRYAEVTPQLQSRLEYELNTIVTMGYVDYFLIVWDFIFYARSQQIEVGPGRGSGAGSLVAYSLGITEVDPIRYQLLFERFLNPERVSMPDFDVDFCYERRSEVIAYVNRKYGSDHVAQIITFGTMAARAVLRDVGRALNMSYSDVDAIAKMVPMELNITLDKALEKNPELREKCESDPQVEKLMTISKRLEGLPRHASTHAAGVVISQKPLTEYLPLQTNGDVITTQFPMTTVEELGLLKMDFLGLRTLTVIRDALEMIQKDTDKKIDLRTLGYDDANVYKMISAADTDGVFQLESQGMRNFLKELQPDCFEDIVAGISLYRPGPMDYIPKYIQGKRHPGELVIDHPLMKPALEVTYGCMVYQEQVMQLVRDMAGYSLGRSDLVRRAMAKKKHDVMVKEREVFVHGMEEDGKVLVPGCVRKGVSEEIANKVFDDMMDFANYAFNKAHAAAYAVVAYRTAWLKYHYPVAFMAATMNSMISNTPKISFYIAYCRKHGMRILPPDINHSGIRFTVEGSNIRFGLSAIRNVGEQAVRQMIRERQENGPYKDLQDFLHRLGGEVLNKKMVESLIRAGAMDSLGGKRSQYVHTYANIMESDASIRKSTIQGQISLFDMGNAAIRDELPQQKLPDIPEFTSRELLNMEKEMTGVYITGHPLSEYQEQLEKLPINTTFFQGQEEGNEALLSDGQNVKLGGLIGAITTKITRSNENMAFLNLEDLYGSVEVLVFPTTYRRYRNEITTGAIVVIEGRVSIKEGEDAKLLASSIEPLNRNQKISRLFLKRSIETPEFVFEAALGELKRYPGMTPVYLLDERNGKKYRLDHHSVEVESRLISGLENLLGKGCVKFD